MKRRTVLALACGPSAVAWSTYLLLNAVTGLSSVGEAVLHAVVLAVITFPLGVASLAVLALIKYLRGRS